MLFRSCCRDLGDRIYEIDYPTEFFFAAVFRSVRVKRSSCMDRQAEVIVLGGSGVSPCVAVA